MRRNALTAGLNNRLAVARVSPQTGAMAVSPPLEQTGIGVVVPYDFALDRELWRWVPDDISLHLTRTPYVPLAVTIEMVAHISDPSVVLPARRLWWPR